MPLNCRFERRMKGTATSVAVSSFELNHVCVLLLHNFQWTKPPEGDPAAAHAARAPAPPLPSFT
jgi:hypothetical protein